MGDMGYDFRGSPSPLVGLVWRVHAVDGGEYTDAGNEFWGLSFDVDAAGAPGAWLIGPSPQPRHLVIRAGERGWGVEFPAHVFLRKIPKLSLLGEMRALPTDGRFFELAGVRFPVPTYEHMEDLADALVAQGILTFDPELARVLAGEEVAYSERQLRRRTTGAAGLGPSRIEQLQRAREAYRLLQSGLTIAQAAVAAGYSDQAHLTRAFRLIAGSTPKQLLADDLDPFMSRP